MELVRMTVLLEGGGCSTGTALGMEGSGLLSCAKSRDGPAREITASRLNAQIFMKLQAGSLLKAVSSIQGDTILIVTAQRLVGILRRILIPGAQRDVLRQLVADS